MMKSPKIRFKGFDGDWEQRKLGDVVDSVDTGKSKFNKEDSSGEYPILGSTSVIGYDDKYDYEGDFILTARVGANAGNLYRHAGKVKISDNTVFIQTSQNIEFLYQLLIQFDVKKLSFGTGQPLVKASELKNLELMMPTDMKEQMRIGMYLKNLDNLITLHQKKCEQLTILKKYMLQKMFPQNGSDKPEIRFDGFTDDWEQRKLGWLVDNDVIEAPKDGNHGEKHPTSDEYVEEGIPFLMASDIRNGRVDLENCKYITKERAEQLDKGFAQEGDVLLTHKATIGEVAILEGLQEEYAMLTPQVTYYRILDNKRLSQKYLYAVFHSESFQNEMQTKAAQSTRPYIGISAQQNLTISLPCSTEEQQRIGEYFASLDTLITLHQNKCNELKELKKFMLQNMFV